MKDRNSHESRGTRMKWHIVTLMAIPLLCPLKGAAQSNTANEARKGSVTTVRANSNDGDHGSTKKPEKEVTIRIWDACDPESFNAAVGPGTCLPGHHGQTDFHDFFSELQLDQIAGAWRFNPLLNASEGVFKLARLDLEPGDHISLENVGGETHTFTRVEEFGGGFFAPLNPLTGNPEPAPECARVLADGSLAPQPETDANQFVEAGTTESGPIAGTRLLPRGTTNWQCCVHPWMRVKIVVRDQQHEQDHQP
jgi:plastocyanin